MVDLDQLSADARQLVVQRRLDSTLSTALDAIGESDIAAYPWLLLYQGRRWLWSNSIFERANIYFTCARELFQQNGDDEGSQWALVDLTMLAGYQHSATSSLQLAQQALQPDACPLVATTPHLGAALLTGVALCHYDADRLDEALATAATAHDTLKRAPAKLQPHGRIQLLQLQAALYQAQGALRQAITTAKQAVLLAQQTQTVDLLPWCRYELARAYWRSGLFAQANTTLDKARRQTEDQAHHQLWCWIVALQGHILRDQNRLAAAHEAYRLAESWGDDLHGPVFLFIREGQLAEARWGCQTILDLAQRRESPIHEADAMLLLALIDLRSGNAQQALDHIDQAISVYAARHYGYRLVSAQLYRAAILLSLDRFFEVDDWLVQGLTALEQEQSSNCAWWMPDLVEMLMLWAIQRKIAPVHTRHVLNQRFLNPLPVLTTIGASIARSTPPSVELEIARQTQLNILPATPPMLAGLDVAGLSLPAEEVGGDFYGYYDGNTAHRSRSPAKPRRFSMALGDISGKGLQAALLTSGTVVALTSAAEDQPSPERLLERVRAALQPFTWRSRLNVALCYVVLRQTRAGWTAEVANAGAVSPLIRRNNGSVEWIEVGGLPLGVALSSSYTPQTAQVGPGDTILLVSDGVLEAMDASGDLFGFDRLEESLQYAPVEQGARAVVAHLLTSVQTFAGSAYQHDDMTFVVAIIDRAEG